MKVKLNLFCSKLVQDAINALGKAKFEHKIEERKEKISFLSACYSVNTAVEAMRQSILNDYAVDETGDDIAMQKAYMEADKKKNKAFAEYLQSEIDLPDWKLLDEKCQDIERDFLPESLAALYLLGVYGV